MTDDELLRLVIDVDDDRLKAGMAEVGDLVKKGADVFELASDAAQDLDGTFEVLARAAVKTKAPLDGVNDLLADLARQETSLIQPVQAAANALDREDDEVNQLLGSLRKQEQALDRAAKGHAKVDAAAKKAGGGVAGMGQSMLQTGRIVQDFTQGGLPGILNNFEGFAMAAGLGPCVAGAVTAIGVAVYVVGPKLVEFGSQFIPVNEHAEALKGTIGKLTERIEELKDKKIKIPVEQHELDTALAKLKTLQEGQAAWDAAHGTRSSAEKQSGQAVAETLAESAKGESAVIDQVTANMIKRANANSDILKESRKRIAAFDAGAAAAGNRFEREQWQEWAKKERENAQQVKDNIEKETRATLGTILKESKEGAAGPQKRLAQELAASGQGDLARSVAEVSPDKVQAANDEETEARIAGEKAQATRERRERAKQADERRSRELNEMGADIEKQTRQENPDLFRNPVLAGRADARKETAAQAKAGKKEADQLAAEARVNLGRIEGEAKKIQDRLGKATQEEYERVQANNAAVAASGGPVARSQRQERDFQAQGGVLGRDYALPQDVLDRRLRGQMATTFRKRGASEQGANLASSQIAEKGDAALVQELAGKQGTNQQALIAVAAAHNQALARSIAQQAQQAQQIGQLMNNARQLNQRANMLGQSALNSGRSS